MKPNRTRLLTAYTACMIPALTGCYADAGADPAAGAGAPTETSERKRAPASNFLPIVRGRLPLIFVHAIRFDEAVAKMGTKDVATKFATSVGKVFDIRKGRNFAYVNAGWKPTAEDIGAAESWMNQVGAPNAKGISAAGDKSVMDTVLKAYKGRGLASVAEAAAQAAAKPASNFGKGEKQTVTAAVVDKKGKAKTEASADDLLA